LVSDVRQWDMSLPGSDESSVIKCTDNCSPESQGELEQEASSAEVEADVLV